MLCIARDYIKKHYDPRASSFMLPDDVKDKASNAYKRYYELLTGNTVCNESLYTIKDRDDIGKKYVTDIHKNIVVILAGSISDESHVKKLVSNLDDHDIYSLVFYASAHKQTFEVMDITQLSLDNKYDAFWASASLLHVPHDKLLDVLKDLKSLLKPNGIGMFSLKLRLSDVDLETFVPDSRYGGVNKFWAYYTEAEIRRFLTEAGLELLEFAYKDNTASEYVTHEWMYCFVKNS